MLDSLANVNGVYGSSRRFIGPKYSFQLENLVAANAAECCDEIVKTVLVLKLQRHDLVMPRFGSVRVKQAFERTPRTLGLRFGSGSSLSEPDNVFFFYSIVKDSNGITRSTNV